MQVVHWVSNYFNLPWNKRRQITRQHGRRWPSPQSPDAPEVIDIKYIDFCLEPNRTYHHTEKFDIASSNLVIRRGHSFRLKLHFNRTYNIDKDAVSFIFTVEGNEKPNHGNGTLVALVPIENNQEFDDPFIWTAKIESIEGDVMSVLIKPSATCPVTKWKLDVDTKLINGLSKTYPVTEKIYVLFNPWCVHDQVFMLDENERNEYVLGDTTLIWRGSHNRLRPTVWKLGQFDHNVLDCALMIIADFGKVSAPYRADPVRTCRALSAAVNSVDEMGVVLGNWTDDFGGGTAPTKWIGSTEILQQFFNTRKPVKYGQCWVFSGVLTTVARALGIPSRIITNYSSAHDTQASLTVDYFVDEKGNVLEDMNTDSIWNYHVWNEVWMQRPDLGVGQHGSYDGWQVVDATPQEQSDGMYRCGPTSVHSVKLGEILRPYDCNFVYSEVNADKVFWRYSGEDRPMKMLRKDTLGIGTLMSTKALGKWEREDITHTYKFEEKTRKERDIMIRALQQATNAFSRYYLNESFNDISFELSVKNDVKIGEPFNPEVIIKNVSKEQTYQVSGNLNVQAILYTGTKRQTVKSIGFEVEVSPESEKVVNMEVTFNEYFSKLKDQEAFMVSCMATVKETNFEFFEQDDFRLRKPDIEITFQGELALDNMVDVIVRLTNPLPIPIHKGIFHIEGAGIDTPLLFKISEIPVGGTAASTFKYRPPYAGQGTLIAKFTSLQLQDVDGFVVYEIPAANVEEISNDI